MVGIEQSNRKDDHRETKETGENSVRRDADLNQKPILAKDPKRGRRSGKKILLDTQEARPEKKVVFVEQGGCCSSEKCETY